MPQVVSVSKLHLLRSHEYVYIYCAWVEGGDIHLSTETTQIYLGFVNICVGIIRGIRQKTIVVNAEDLGRRQAASTHVTLRL